MRTNGPQPCCRPPFFLIRYHLCRCHLWGAQELKPENMFEAIGPRRRILELDSLWASSVVPLPHCPGKHHGDYDVLGR
jgi:hypothetical protein